MDFFKIVCLPIIIIIVTKLNPVYGIYQLFKVTVALKINTPNNLLECQISNIIMLKRRKE